MSSGLGTIGGIPNTLLQQLGAPGAPKPSTGDQSVSQSQFLNLFVAQLQHQDPLSPLEPNELTAQLAQFSSLEQLTAINSRLDKLVDAAKPDNGASSLLGLIGKRVTFEGSRIAIDKGEATPVRYTLEHPASVLTATIRTTDGSVVRTVELGAQGTGAHTFQFDGKDAHGVKLADGIYTIGIAAVAEGEKDPKLLDLLAEATVDGVDLSSDPPVLLAGPQRLTLDEIKEVHAPES
jgi:flagellar basal-body rod modification protein FlgD